MLENISSDVKHRVDKAYETLINMEKLITKLLQLTKAESGMALNFKAINLRSLLTLIVEDHRRKNPNRIYDLQLPESDILIEADIDALAIALSNLLENAHQYATPHSSIDIALSTEKTITIKNDCDTIPQEQLEKITQRYHRIKQNGSGLGIGLSIVQSIVHQTNGQLYFRSPIPGKSCGLSIEIKFN